MKIYKPETTLEAAKQRISWIFDEFESVIVSFSGGKDSTVVLNLALAEAERRKRLPLKVLFLDQEAEWQMTIDYVRKVFSDKRIWARWYQVQTVQMNASSGDKEFFTTWDEKEKDKWMRPKEESSIKRISGLSSLDEIDWSKVMFQESGVQRSCFLAGVRAEESPNRFMGLTHYAAYKWATWGSRLSKKYPHYTMYPIYDWSYTDVWKAIHEHRWDYCRLYDEFYRYGVSTPNMRVSSLNHAVAIRSLFYLQELEPDTYNRLVRRIPGADTSGKMNKDDFFQDKLPFMFSSWKEYRDYLLQNLISSSLHREFMRQEFLTMDKKYAEHFGDKLYRLQTRSVVSNDVSCMKLKQWCSSFSNKGFDDEFRKGKAQSGVEGSVGADRGG